MVCAGCMKMCCLGGKNSVDKGLRSLLFAGTNYWACSGFAEYCFNSPELQTTNPFKTQPWLSLPVQQVGQTHFSE